MSSATDNTARASGGGDSRMSATGPHLSEAARLAAGAHRMLVDSVLSLEAAEVEIVPAAEAAMTEPLTKPVMRVRVGGDLGLDLFAAHHLTVKGRDAWPLRKLIDNGARGVTAFDEIGPRLSHYVFKLRRAGFTIETKDEHHGGAFAGTHGRYVLVSPVRIVEDTAT